MLNGLILIVIAICGLLLCFGKGNEISSGIANSHLARFLEGNKLMMAGFVLVLLTGVLRLLGKV